MPVSDKNIVVIVLKGIFFKETVDFPVTGHTGRLQIVGNLVRDDIQILDIHHQAAGNRILVLSHNLHEIDPDVRIQQILHVPHEKHHNH